MSSRNLQYIITVDDKGSANIKKFSGEVEKTGKETKKATGAFGGFEKAIVGTIVAFGAKQLFDFTGEMVQLGLQVKRSDQALIAYAGSASEAARTTKLVSEAAGGTISRLTAAQNAAQLMAMGLATSAEEAAKLTKVAITLGASMGKGPQESFENFSLLLANQSLPRLDTFGISSGRVRERILELMSATEGMTRETAFMTAVMEDADEKMAALDASGFEAGDSVQRLTVLVEDQKIAYALAITDGIVPFLDRVLELRDRLEEANNAANRSTDSMDEYRLSLITGRQHVDLLDDGQRKLVESFSLTANEIAFSKTAIDGWKAGALQASSAAGELADNTGQAVIEIKNLSATSLASLAIQDLNREFQEGNIDADTYKETFIDLSTKHGILTHDEALLQSALAQTRQDFNLNKIGAEEFEAAIDGVIDKVDALQTLAQTAIRFKLQFETEGGTFGGAGGVPDPGLQTENAGGIFSGE